MKIKYCNLPSTINLGNNSSGSFLDINSIFWNDILSRDFISGAFEKYQKDEPVSGLWEDYFNYLISNISDIKNMMLDCWCYTGMEKNLFFCLKAFYYILHIINSVYKERVSLPYGIFPSKKLKDAILNPENENEILNRFYNKVL